MLLFLHEESAKPFEHGMGFKLSVFPYSFSDSKNIGVLGF